MSPPADFDVNEDHAGNTKKQQSGQHNDDNLPGGEAGHVRGLVAESSQQRAEVVSALEGSHQVDLAVVFRIRAGQGESEK